MTIAIPAFVKMFVVFAYLLIVAYSEWIVEKAIPESSVKRFLLRKF